jgi:hypothetical protein
MEKNVGRMGAEPIRSDGETQRAQQPTPGKVTRTSKLSPSRESAVQRKATAAAPGMVAPQAQSLWELTMNPWMDAAHRGATAMAVSGTDAASPELEMAFPPRGYVHGLDRGVDSRQFGT